ncbi:hypothetical protein MBLNU230_g7177t1 [Neophaeotheca triangularis]
MDPSILFSPSKARQHEAQARDWVYIDTWLARKYRVPPAFERNEQTLQALLALASATDGADETRDLRCQVEKAALGELREREGGLSGREREVYGVLGEAVEGVGGGESLGALAGAAVAVDAVDGEGVGELGGKVVALTHRRFELEERVRRVEAQLGSLRAEQARTEALILDLQDEGFQVSSELPRQISEWQRNSKHLKAKIAEYDERLGGAKTTGNAIERLHQIEILIAETAKQEKRLAELHAELEVYQDLPADVRGAQQKLDKARNELAELTMKRDGLFEGLSNG